MNGMAQSFFPFRLKFFLPRQSSLQVYARPQWCPKAVSRLSVAWWRVALSSSVGSRLVAPGGAVEPSERARAREHARLVAQPSRLAWSARRTATVWPSSSVCTVGEVDTGTTGHEAHTLIGCSFWYDGIGRLQILLCHRRLRGPRPHPSSSLPRLHPFAFPVRTHSATHPPPPCRPSSARRVHRLAATRSSSASRSRHASPRSRSTCSSVRPTTDRHTRVHMHQRGAGAHTDGREH